MTTAVNLLPLPTPIEEPPPNPPSWVWGNGSGLDSGDNLYDDGYDEGSLILNGNLWNTDPTSTGAVTMTYNASAGSLTTDVSFSNWIAASPSSGNPAGYPKVNFGSGTSPDLFTLPATVAAIAQQQSVELTTTYSLDLSQSPNLPVDIAYDGFLTNGQDGPREMEMEIFLYTKNMSFSNFETLTIPTWINGQLQNAQWGVFVSAGGTGGPLVGFDLMPSVSGVPVGTYLADFLAHMSDTAILGQIQTNHLGTFQASQVNGYTFDGLDLGSEFFPEDNSSQLNQAYYSYTISSYSMLQNPLSPNVTDQAANQTWTEGQALSFQLVSNTFTDPQGEALIYSAMLSSGAALPSWLRLQRQHPDVQRYRAGNTGNTST